MVKGLGCPWRGPRFDFQCPHGGRTTISPAAGDPVYSSDFTSTGHAGAAHEDMQAKHPYKYIMNFKNSNVILKKI